MSSRKPGNERRRRQNRKKQMQEKREHEKELREKQIEDNLHQHNVRDANNDFDKMKSEYLQELTDTGMSDAGVNLLDNMVDRSFVLGNLKDAEVHEIKWRMHAMFLKIKAMYPNEDSILKGPFRAFCFDDPDENLTPLNEQQEIIISQMIIGITVFVSRSRQGWQNELMSKAFSVSEVKNPGEEEKDNMLRGLFS